MWIQLICQHKTTQTRFCKLYLKQDLKESSESSLLCICFCCAVTRFLHVISNINGEEKSDNKLHLIQILIACVQIQAYFVFKTLDMYYNSQATRCEQSKCDIYTKLDT